MTGLGCRARGISVLHAACAAGLHGFGDFVFFYAVCCKMINHFSGVHGVPFGYFSGSSGVGVFVVVHLEQEFAGKLAVRAESIAGNVFRSVRQFHRHGIGVLRRGVGVRC